MTATDKDLVRDAATAPGPHPVATGTGAAAGGLTGAAVGSVAGPIGTALGAAIGVVVGGLAGNAAGDALDPAAQEAYWREAYASEPYYRKDYGYDDYAPAYGLGIGSRVAEKYRERPYDEIESDLAAEWDTYRGSSRLSWPEASPAARAAWARVQRGRGAV